MDFTAKFLDASCWADFVSYFEFGGSSGCWCMNHRLPIGLEFEGEAAKLAMKQLVVSDRVFGVLAYAAGEEVPVGWASLDRRKTLPGHDCIRESIDCSESHWSLHCVTSRTDFKGKGVEPFLVSAALRLAEEMNATIVEAYPEPGSSTEAGFVTWNTFGGFEADLEIHGFERVEAQVDHGVEYCPMQKKIW